MNISEVDIVLASCVEGHIETDLGPDFVLKLKKRLAERGYSLTEAIKIYYPFEEILGEYFGEGAKGLIQQILNAVMKRVKRNVFEINDKKLTRSIMQLLADTEKSIIIDAIKNSKSKSMSIPQIIEKTKLKNVYKHISTLCDAGLLIPSEKMKSSSGNKAVTFRQGFEILQFDLEESIKTVVEFTDDGVKRSNLLSAIKANNR